MRNHLIASALVVALFALPTHAVRFAGSGFSTSNIHHSSAGAFLHDTMGNFHWFSPQWQMDVDVRETDLTLHRARISFSGTMQINPAESMDLNLEAVASGLPLSFMPDADAAWPVDAYAFGTLRLWGVYHGLAASNPFDVEIAATDEGRMTIDVGNLPQSVETGPISYQTTNGERLSNSYHFFRQPHDEPVIVSPTFSIHDATFAIPFLTLNRVTEWADFDTDGLVDGRDLTIWTTGYGGPNAPGDANLDGFVDGADFLVWQRSLGELPATSIPEPSGPVLLLLAASAWATQRQGVR
jgi:hypothetical protein